MVVLSKTAGKLLRILNSGLFRLISGPGGATAAAAHPANAAEDRAVDAGAAAEAGKDGAGGLARRRCVGTQCVGERGDRFGSVVYAGTSFETFTSGLVMSNNSPAMLRFVPDISRAHRLRPRHSGRSSIRLPLQQHPLCCCLASKVQPRSPTAAMVCCYFPASGRPHHECRSRCSAEPIGSRSVQSPAYIAHLSFFPILRHATHVEDVVAPV